MARTATRTIAGAMLLALGLPGCYGGLGGSDGAGGDGAGDASGGSDEGGSAGDDGGDDGVEAACDPSVPPRASLLRMSRTNYVHALESIFGAAAVAAIRPTVDTLPVAKAGVFATEVPPVGFTEVSAYFKIADALAQELTKDDVALAALDACLPSVPAGADASSDACLVGFVDALGPKVLRRPLTADDRTRLAADYAVGGGESVGEGVATLLLALLIDPAFLYFVETQGDELSPGIAALTDHELAARLARVLWDDVPDDEWLAAADAGLDDDALAVQVDRMLADGRARTAFERFTADWLALDVMPEPSPVLFPDAAARAALREDMRAELLAFAATVAFDQHGGYAELLLDRTTTIGTPELAQIYGVEPGANTLPDDRAGLLSRAGWLATPQVIRSDAGHIIKRGRRLGEFLCRPVPPPDPGNFPTEDPADPANNPEQGIRERFQTAAAEPQCAGCHKLLDAYGAPFGHYGAAGQWIDVETVDVDGTPVGIAIDTASTITLDDDIAVADPVALSEAIAASDVGPECLADQLTRNLVAHPPDDGDACLRAAAREALAPADGAPQSLRDAIVRLVSSDHFRQVSLP